MRAALLTLLALSCSAPTAPSPTPTNACGWPYAGELIAPPAPPGAICYAVTTNDPYHVTMLRRTDPDACAWAPDGACVMNGCAGVMSVYPGDVLDVWARNADAFASITIEVASVCCRDGVCMQAVP